MNRYLPRLLLLWLFVSQASAWALIEHITTYQYDDFDRLISVTDAHGNRTQQIEINGGAAQTTTYSYDTLDRLTSVEYPDKSTTYTYDANYNRLTETVTGSTPKSLTYSYNARNQLTGVEDTRDPNHSIAYAYDANGNQIQKTVLALPAAPTVQRFVFDARNHLRQVKVGGSTVGQFLYDAHGLRIEKQGERGTERYTYDDNSLLQEYDSSSATLAKYDYGAHKLISLIHATEPTQYYLTDALNSVVDLTNTNGQVQARYQYDAFGNKRAESGTSANRFAFTGYVEDKETNLLYAKARYYDSDTGRFLSQDAWEGETNTPPSLHKYLYAYQNPTVYWDPSGNCVDPITFMACAALAGVIVGSGHSIIDSLWGTEKQQEHNFERAVSAGTMTTGALMLPLIAAEVTPVVSALGADIAASASAGTILVGESLAVAPQATALAAGIVGEAGIVGGAARTRATSEAVEEVGTVTKPMLTLEGSQLAKPKFSSLETPAKSNIQSSLGTEKNNPLPAGQEPYQMELFPKAQYKRVEHYGNTPTAAQKASVPEGMEFDHNPMLVKHYYEGAGEGSIPGYNLTNYERKAFGVRLDSGSPATPKQQRIQGAEAAKYSKEQKKIWGLGQEDKK